MSTLLIVTHEVKNYTSWREVFDADETNRTAAGLKTTGVYRAVNNENLITIINEVTNVDDALAFGQSPKLRETMKRAGVISEPEFMLLEEVTENVDHAV